MPQAGAVQLAHVWFLREADCEPQQGAGSHLLKADVAEATPNRSQFFDAQAVLNAIPESVREEKKRFMGDFV